MAAIPRELIESELFGHEKGAFTGATTRRPAGSSRPRAARCSSTRSATCRSRPRPGCCACCSRASTCRSAAAPRSATDVRIVAATHRDLRQMVGQGLFREDLFYRLNVVPIRLPPLRERADDIPALAQHFLARPRDGLPLKTLDAQAMERLKRTAGPATSASWRTSCAAWPCSTPRKSIATDIIEFELRRHGRRPAPGGGASERGPRLRGRAAHEGLFRGPRRTASAAAGLYDRLMREVERPSDSLGPCPRRAAISSRRPTCWASTATRSQEDPGPGHPGQPWAKITHPGPVSWHPRHRMDRVARPGVPRR